MALSADRNTPRRDGEQFEYPVIASDIIYAGSIVFLDTAGNAEPASAATGKICAGVAQEQADNSTGLAAAIKVKVRAGCFLLKNGETITKAHIGDVCYANDDETVYRTSTGRSVVGAIVDVESAGVWVSIQAPLAAATAGLLAANNLSDVGTLATAQSNLGLTDGTIAARFEDVTIDDDLDVGDDVRVATDAVVIDAGLKSVAAKGPITGLQAMRTETSGTVGGPEVDGDAIVLDATDNGVVTLPDAAAANKGHRLTVINSAADGAAKISISPHSSDKIYGGIMGAAGGSLVTFGAVLDKDIINTKATALKGDFATLVSDGSTGWYVTAGRGVWASEA